MRFTRRHATFALAFSPSFPLLLRPSQTRFSARPSQPGRPCPRRTPALCTAAKQVPPPSAPSDIASASPSNAAAAADATAATPPLTFQDALLRLQRYWSDAGCIVWHPYNVEVGAGTMNPATFLRVLGPEPWRVAYDEPSIRPDDSRYGQNPNRLQRHTQFQVIVKPAPVCAQELVVGSYRALGIDTCKHDVRFVEDNWESPALGAWGLGWEVWLDGMEVTQFTYFQQAGGIPLNCVAVEITYGLERIIMSLQGKSHFKDIVFSPGVTYGEIFMQNEMEMSKYNLDEADVARNNQMFELYEAEALALLEKRLPVPAYNYLLKASHTFNVLDARGAVGVTERARYFQRMRFLARDVAKLWVERREEAGFPLLADVPPLVGEADLIPVKPRNVSKLTADMVFEIGLEELPAADVSHAIAQVARLMANILGDAKLDYGTLSVQGTPRRVVAFVADLKTRQDDELKRVRGPPLRIAVKDGELTKAGKGFLRSQGITDQSTIEFNEEEGYMYATVSSVGSSAVEILAEKIPGVLMKKMNFGKSMRWNESGVSFSRPVRWLLCLLDEELVPFAFANVQTAKTTRSLRCSDGFAKDVTVSSAGSYHDVLSKLQIVLSQADRASTVETEASRLAQGIGGIVPAKYLGGGLLDEVTDLVENPIPLLGRFDESFLRLPKEVLVTVMEKHQRYFPVVDESTGKLMNGFVAVANGDSSLVDIAAIRRGNEDVLRARYSDASFFYDRDTVGKKLGDFVADLESLTFQESLGSMLDKVKRVEITTKGMCELMKLDEAAINTALHAASLYKADLTTSMVVEMTSLAGTMGRHYVEKSQEAPAAVAQAIFEASLPRFSGDELPQSSAGAAVSIADRMDSLVSLFSVGLMPKATADPFALRRAALGAVQTLIGSGARLDIREAVQLAANTLTSQTGHSVEISSIKDVVEFVSRRLESYLLDNVGIRDDVVKAVLSVDTNASDPTAASEACKTLSGMLADDSLREVVTKAQATHGRAARLLCSIKGLTLTELQERPVNTAIFECDEEHRLWEALSELPEDGTLQSRVQRLADMKSVVDNFFDNVFVNADNDGLRLNRLAICSRIVQICDCAIDMTKLLP